MGEKQSVLRRAQKDIPYQSIAVVPRLTKQFPKLRKAEALAKHGGCLNGATILGREEIGAGQHHALNGDGKPSIGEVARAAEQLLQKQRVAAGTFDALIGE
jgi:hypothetical protein